MKFDRTTYGIIGHLAQDAMRKRNQIARDLGVSESNLSKRISNLIAEKIIKRFTVELDLQRLGLRVHAISLVSMEHQADNKMDEVEKTLQSLRSATEYATLYGEYDFFVRWMCRDSEHLNQEIKTLLAVDGIKVETHLFGARSFRQANVFSIIPDEDT